MASTPRLVLVDGSAMFFRAYYAIPGNLRSSTGQPTNAIYGFATMFRKLFSGRTPEKGVVVFDAPGPTFRTAQYSEYKANRKSPPEDLICQRPWVDRIVEAYGFSILRIPGYEADDVIGTLTHRAALASYEITIVSADKDFVQLLRPGVKMFDPFTGAGTTYDVERATKKWGIPPHQFIDYLALLGDKIDNIPGVPGIGKKGATELLERYQDLEDIFNHIEELKGRQKSALEEHADSARLSRSLATIDLQVPLPISLSDLGIPKPDKHHLNKLYQELEFYSLLTQETTSEANHTDPVPICQSADDFNHWLQSSPHVHPADTLYPVAIEPIWDAPSIAPEALVGLCLAASSTHTLYINLTESIPDYLKLWLSDPKQPKVAHEAKLLYVMLSQHKVSLKGLVGDTQLGSFLVDPNKLIPHRLDQVSREYIQKPLSQAKNIIGSGKNKKTFRDSPEQEVANWSASRASAIIDIWSKLKESLEREGQTQQLHEVDIPLSQCLADMERVGVGIDITELSKIESEFSVRLSGIEQSIYELAGKKFNIRSTKQLSEVLFEDLGLPVIKKTKTGYSTNAEVLERLASDYTIAAHLLEQRKLEKLINTYTRVLQEAVHPVTKRVHATFQQTTGVTGRLISTDPDLQRTPIKTPEGERIRHAFVAAPGHKLISADWSQIELRLLAHVSQDPYLLESFKKEQDIHTRTAGELFHVPIAEVSKDQRRVGKTVNFATVYGQGATALGQILKIPRKAAQTYINTYFSVYAGVRTWLDNTIKQAKITGFVETIHGRRRYIPELSSNATMERAGGERIAANTPIQGSAADICKAAMLAIKGDLAHKGLKSQMVLQIHDELLFECPESEVEEVCSLVHHHMSTIVRLSVPLVTDIGVGNSWAEAH